MFGASVCPLVSWPTLNTATTMTNSEVIVPEKVNLHPYFIIGAFSLFPAMFLQEYTQVFSVSCYSHFVLESCYHPFLFTNVQ